MKRIYIFFLSFVFLSSNISRAGGDARVRTAPAAFMGDEEVTIYFHVFGSDLEDDEGPIYLWSGANGGALDFQAECIKEDDNLWSFTLIPDTYFSTDVTSINGKLANGGGTETNPFVIQVFDPTVTEGTMITVVPATSIYSENVSIIFNSKLSDRDDLTDVDPIYMWTWSTEGFGDAANQGSWGSIDPSAICEKIGDNLWRKDIVPQQYWEITNPMAEIGCLFRDFSGGSQTEDYTITLFAPPVTTVPKVIRTFPVKFTQDDVVTIYYDPKLDEDHPEMQQVTEMYVQTSTNTEEENDPLPGNWIIYTQTQLNKAKMVDEGDGVWSIMMIPSDYFSTEATYQINQINLTFRDKGGLKKSEKLSVKVCN